MAAIDRRTFLTGVGLLVAASARGGEKPVGIKIGQIGTGHAHAAGKMASMRRSRDFEVVGVVEPDGRLRAKAKRNPVYRDLPWMAEQQLLAADGLQAVAVETEVCDLLATAARCVRAGKPIHLDKPAGESLPAFKKVLDDATRQGLTVQMGYMFRYNPAFQLCFRAVREGWLGEVFSIHTVISKAIPKARRAPLARYRGGSIFELGCHVLDAVVSVLGKPDRVVAYPRRSGPYDDELMDNGLAVFEYPKATATVRSALLEVDGGRRRQFVVCGTQGTVDIRPLEPPAVRLTLARARGGFRKGTQEVPMPKYVRYDDDFADLARILRGEKKSDFPPAHDLAVQEAVLRACDMPVR